MEPDDKQVFFRAVSLSKKLAEESQSINSTTLCKLIEIVSDLQNRVISIEKDVIDLKRSVDFTNNIM